MNVVVGVVGNTAVGALAGFVARPCCVIPAALSVAGLGSAGVGEAFATHRWWFLTFGSLALAAALSMTFRRAGGWFIRCMTAGATLIAFAWSTGIL